MKRKAVQPSFTPTICFPYEIDCYLIKFAIIAFVTRIIDHPSDSIDKIKSSLIYI